MRPPELTSTAAPGGRTFTTRRAVRLGDVSPRGRLRLDAVARYLQDVADDDTTDASLADNLSWVVRRTTIECHVPASFGEQLTLTTFCGGVGSRWAERRTTVVGERGARIEAGALWVFLDPVTGRPARLSTQFRELFEPAAGGRGASVRRTHPDPPLDAASRPWAVRAVDIDLADHVNNAVYWCAAEELCADGDPPDRFVAEIEYRAGIDRHDRVVLTTDPRGAGDRDPERAWFVVADDVRASLAVWPLD